MSGYDFDLTVEKAGNATRVSVRGELDLGTAPQLEKALSDAREDSERIVLDLRDLTFMDSTGLRLLLVAAEQGREGPPVAMLPPRGGDALVALEETGIAALLPLEKANGNGNGG
jgi:anti-anti-sigma factor